MTTFTASWILPIASPPIRDGVVTVDDGRIVAVGKRPHRRTVAPSHLRALGSVAVLPALVNAHTHLELSHLHERIHRSTDFNDWLTALMTLRRSSDASPASIVEAARQAIGRANATGTGLVGDVSNTLITVPLLRDVGMPAHVFHELTGFNHPDPRSRACDARAAIDVVGDEGGGVRVSLAPHAPYSVSPALFKGIRADVDAHPRALTSVHLGESAAEVELLRHGTGPAQVML